MNKKMMYEFISDFWKNMVAQTCEEEEHDYGKLLDIAVGFEEKYPDISNMCALICMGYINGLENEENGKNKV